MNRRKPDLPDITILLGRVILVLTIAFAVLPTAARASELTILYSNDIRGETEPCG